MKVLVTGGMGYIGSHTCIQLIEAGMTPIIFDNLYNSKASVIGRLKEVTGQDIEFVQGDIRDRELMVKTLSKFEIDAVIHFAGLKRWANR